MKCPACSAESSTTDTCSSCGAVLSPMKCRSCQTDLAVGVRACSNCGARARPSGFKAGAMLGAAVVAAIAAGVFLVPGRSSAPVAPAATPPPGPMAAPLPPDAPMAPVPTAPFARGEPKRTPREEADELFNVTMAAAEQGVAATVAEALPQAILAYQQLGPLDDDASFHLASLQLVARDFSAARATADGILARAPNHLLALSVAARAAAGAGDAAAMRKHYETFLAGYDAELKKPLPEYQDHARVLPIDREEAKKALGK